MEKKLPELTPQQLAEPYAQLYYRELVSFSEEELKDFRQPMDAKLAVRPEDMERMLDTYRGEGENGYCFFKDSGAYIAVRHLWKGITTEMYYWWLQWYNGNDFRYALWYPGKHFMCRDGWVMEDIGRGLEDVYFSMPTTPQVMGISQEAYDRSDYKGIIGSCGISKPRDSVYDHKAPEQSVVAHFIRDTSNGMEIRSRFWVGYGSQGDGLIYTQFDDVTVEEKMVRDLAIHCKYEFANLEQLLSILYQMLH